MRNLFDYYSQNENQLTHALFAALNNDSKLLTSFVRVICGVDYQKPQKLEISVQSYPFSNSYDDSEIESRNIPDAWIFNDDGLALVFEAKIGASLTQLQLNGHQKVANKFGFDQVKYFTIAASEEAGEFENWKALTWRDIYVWLCEHKQSVWAKHAAEYFEILEAQMIDNGQLEDGELTTFTGFPEHENGYSYLVAKSTIIKAMKVLRQDKRLVDALGMNPETSGRGAITGQRSDSVWDYLAIDDYTKNNEFTRFLHLTLGIGEDKLEAMVTVPNKIITAPRKEIKSLGLEGFRELCVEIIGNMDPLLQEIEGAVPLIRGVQRRYPSQRSIPYVDALIEADLRTAFKELGKPKYQPQWIEAVYDAFVVKKSNYQFQIGVVFKYEKCPAVHDADALDLIVRGWLACAPLVNLCRE